MAAAIQAAATPVQIRLERLDITYTVDYQ